MLTPVPGVWYLYDNAHNDQTTLKGYLPGYEASCPHCGAGLVFRDYNAACCGLTFKRAQKWVIQIEPVGTHSKTSGRGWDSLRPWTRPAP